MKREFLVVYDYGTGGVWGFATATSKAEINEVLPNLQVVDERPEWMDDETARRVREESLFVVGIPSTYPRWLTIR